MGRSGRRWLFLPIDDRPVTCLFPQRLAPLGGIELVTPPRERLGRFLSPAQPDWLAQWLEAEAPGCEGAILSLEMLAFGGLIASRSMAVPTAVALQRLALLRRLKQRGLKLFASNVLMRLGITVTSPETAASHYLLYRWSQLAADPARRAELEALERQIPAQVLAQYRAVRERNHRVNQEAVRLAGEGSVDFLLLLQEDASPEGVHRQEQAALRESIARLGAGNRVRLLPGADESALLLLSRAALAGREPPEIMPVYAREETAGQIALFEDRPLRETAALQIDAAGGRIGAGGILLFINTPVRRYGDVNEVTDPSAGPYEVSDGSPGLISRISESLMQGRAVAVADVAFANGADWRFADALIRTTDWRRLASYAGWNTAGNSLGSAVSMALLWLLSGGQQRKQHLEALLLRLVDDYAYQTVVRTELNRRLAAQGRSPLNLGPAAPAVSAQVNEALAPYAERFCRLGPGADGYRLQRFSARLPWPRTFEVEIDLALGLSFWAWLLAWLRRLAGGKG